MSTHALMSAVPAESAVTNGPISRPPRKYSFSPPVFDFTKKNTPMPSMHSKYTTNTMSSTVERSIDVSLSLLLLLACLFSTVPLFHNANHYKSEYIAG